MDGKDIRQDERGELGIVRIPFAQIDAIAVVAIEQACAEMRPVTALDFRNVRFVSSTGVSALMKFAVATRKKGYKLFAVNVGLHHQKIFKLIEIARLMPI